MNTCIFKGRLDSKIFFSGYNKRSMHDGAAPEFLFGISMTLKGSSDFQEQWLQVHGKIFTNLLLLFSLPKTSAIYHTHSKRSSLHDVTIKGKASKRIVTFKYKTMAYYRMHLFPVKDRCEMLIETITIINCVFAFSSLCITKNLTSSGIF